MMFFIYFLFVFLLLLFCYWYFSKMNTPTIVINRYNEDLSWLKDGRKDPSIYIYNKGESLDATTIPYHSKVKDVPNIGRETEGYLRFMIEEYDTLQNDSYYIFLQGNPVDHSKQIIDKIHHLYSTCKSPFIHLGDLVCVDCDQIMDHTPSYYLKLHSSFIHSRSQSVYNKNGVLFSNIIPDRNVKMKLINEKFIQKRKARIDLYQKFFTKTTNIFNWSEGALFAVKGYIINQYPKSYYIELRNELLNRKEEDLGFLYERIRCMLFFHGKWNQ